MVVTATADPISPDEEFEGLETRAIEVLGQFSLDTDDPANYTDRFTFMQQRREWPGKRYPPGADLEEDPYGRVSHSFLPNNLNLKEPLGVQCPPPVLVLPVLLLLHHLLHSLRKAEPSWT